MLAYVGMAQNIVAFRGSHVNEVFWAVATEWQIYFVFALILLPAWRSWGVPATVAIAFAIGFAPVLSPARELLWYACYWYVGLFALGMAAAHLARAWAVNASPSRGSAVACLAVSAGAVAAAVGVNWYGQDAAFVWPVADVLTGLASATLILACAVSPRGPGSIGVVRAIVGTLESRPALALGAVSYSLYLTHGPVRDVVGWVFKRFATRDPLMQLLFQFAVNLPICLVAAWAFYLGFERPFLSSRARRAKDQEVSAIAPRERGEQASQPADASGTL